MVLVNVILKNTALVFILSKNINEEVGHNILSSHPQPLIFPEGRSLLNLQPKSFTLFVTPSKLEKLKLQSFTW